MTSTWPRLAGQAALYAAFAAFIGLFSSWPPYQALAPGQAVITVSFVHHGLPVAECRRLTPEELAKLPPNMRNPIQCGRERSPVTVELDLDGTTVYRHVAAPAGLSRDGASAVYHRMTVPAGSHRIAVRLRDSVSPGVPAHTRDAVLDLRPAQVLVIDFDPQQGGIKIT